MYIPEGAEIGGVLLDWLTIGRCYESKDVRDKLLEFFRRNVDVWLGNYRICRGLIWYGGLAVGHILGSTGGASAWGWKLQFCFSGTFFRPRQRGGAALGYDDAWRLVLGLEARATLPQEVEEAARAWYEAQGLALLDPSDVQARRDAEHTAKLLRRARELVGAVEQVQASYSTLDRVDYAVEVTLPDDADPFLPLQWDRAPARAWPTHWGPRTVIVNRRKGATLYVGTAEDPLEKRGSHPLLRIYRKAAPSYASEPSTPAAEAARAAQLEESRYLRLEVECPRVVNVNEKRTLGEVPAADLAARVLGSALGVGRLETQPYAQAATHAPSASGATAPVVPILNVGPLKGSQTGRPYLGHARAELRRLMRCGWSNFANVLRTQLTARADAEVHAWSPALPPSDDASPDDRAARLACLEIVPPVIEQDELDEALRLLLYYRARAYPSARVPIWVDDDDVFVDDQRYRSIMHLYGRGDRYGDELAYNSASLASV